MLTAELALKKISNAELQQRLDLFLGRAEAQEEQDRRRARNYGIAGAISSLLVCVAITVFKKTNS